MNAFTITTPDVNRFPLGELSSSGRRFGAAALFGAIAALGVFAVAGSDSNIAQSCRRVSTAWPSDAETAGYASAWPGETPSVDLFAEGQPAGFSLPGESASTDMFAAGPATGGCL